MAHPGVDLIARQRSECQGKFGFDSKPLAIRVSQRMKDGASVYRCAFCSKWHIGHRLRRK